MSLITGELILMNESMMLDVEIVYLETLLRHSFYLIDSPDFNYEDSSDYKAKMTQILETLNLANTDMPCKIIANFKDAETVFKYTLIKCHQIEEFTKSNFQVLRKIDDIMKNRQQTDQVSIGGKMLYASAHNEFARYQNDAITKQTLLNKALESSLALKKDIKDKTYIVENDIVKMCVFY